MADPSTLPPLSPNHLSHPETWVTGDDPATGKQKAFVASLEAQHPDLVPKEGLDVDGLGKSGASEVIDALKKGKEVLEPRKGGAGKDEQVSAIGEKGKEVDVKGGKEGDDAGAKEPEEEGGEQVGEKRKAPSKTPTKKTGSSPIPSKSAPAKEPTETEKDEDDADIDMNGKDAKPSKQSTLDHLISHPPTQGAGTETETLPLPEDTVSSGPPKKKAKSNGTTSSTKTSEPEPSASKPVETASANPVEADKSEDTVPGDSNHLDHPENWTTGADPATEKQKGFIKVLEKQKGAGEKSVDAIGKSEASERIEELQKM
ncbi:hypothetical protein P7C73_g6451, partial [Tremellales sp. Uapishka_1]